MKEIQHPHVMNLIGVCVDAGPAPYIVLPYMGNGDLLSYLKKHRKALLVTKEIEDDEVSPSFLVMFLFYLHNVISLSLLSFSPSLPLFS